MNWAVFQQEVNRWLRNFSTLFGFFTGFINSKPATVTWSYNRDDGAIEDIVVPNIAKIIDDANNNAGGVFAGFALPVSLNSGSKNNWGKYLSNDNGAIFEPVGSPGLYYGIKVLESGYYHVFYAQRSVNPDASMGAYGVISLDGDRGLVEGQSDKLFTHDHSYRDNSFSNSVVIGHFNAGDIISAGWESGTGAFGSEFCGYLIVKKLGGGE